MPVFWWVFRIRCSFWRHFLMFFGECFLFYLMGGIEMEEIRFRRMLYAIVAGLNEKMESERKYPYSKHLLYGMNLFAAFTHL